MTGAGPTWWRSLSPLGKAGLVLAASVAVAAVLYLVVTWTLIGLASPGYGGSFSPGGSFRKS